jgi:peptidoglycan/LPS O-acetylase OafA/YrhL
MTEFRRDVEGLRALAIGIVLLAHAGVPFAAGGFVGVDVFFVISGFLITRLLVGELDRTGRVSLTRFYARRVKRLMPQALTALVAVALLARFLLSPLRADAALNDVVASGVYAMNWHLSAQAVDYFATGAADGPLDHFWSLAVEEQFYLAWPLLLLVLPRRFALPAITAITVASLAYAASRTAYFSTAARAWELGVGGLLALWLPGHRITARAGAAAAWAGIAAIAAATVAFSPETGVPGLPTLLPALGAAALVAAGTSSSPARPTRWLSTRGACFVGRLSYAWYVWHWPVLVFAAAVLGPLGVWGGIALTAVSFVPAIVTHRLIEEPLRRSRLRAPRAVVAAPITAAGALLVAVAISWSIPSPPTLAADKAEGAPQLERTRTIQRSAKALRPTPRDADEDRGRSYADGCLADAEATASPRCVYGDRRSPTTVVLFGDSHAMQWFPALDRLARRRHWRLVQLAKAGCPPSAVDVIYAPEHRAYPECRVWREDTLRRIERERPALVVVTESVQYRIPGLGAESGMRALADGYAPVLARLQQTVPRVVVLGDTPMPPRDVPDCVAGAMRHLPRCAFGRRAATARAALVAAGAARVPGVEVIDVTGRFCVRSLCPAVIGNVLVYRNSGHLTATYAATLAPWLARRLS